ncbi:hypothetical protein [Chitinimonas sp. BJB300]|uniref:hypothetical protein n=1 Tax=Chitinimonas sp. BJB300 TaxID=1559339 RepID=UPI0011118CAB|nr:hypothetical protein [Chitinimonas sp. BJB300]TSJ84759.1 hypothetical protein FG002_018570 [Chitinimonas sp. BJB300]
MSKWLAVFLLACVAFTAQAKEVGTVYWVPFQIQTYLPVTVDDIATMMDAPCVLTSEGAIRDIVEAAKPTQKPFNGNAVRAKISEGKATLVVDNQGTLNMGGKMLAMSEETLKEVVLKHGGCPIEK